jgi:hypothetical protein
MKRSEMVHSDIEVDRIMNRIPVERVAFTGKLAPIDVLAGG